MEQKGSFIGFSFGRRHSSKMGILRTSGSKGITKNLLPRLREEVSENRVGTLYHLQTNYDKQEISVPFAFYGLTEDQLVLLKNTFNDKKLHSLIFDEEPYKVWQAKLTGTAVLKHFSFEIRGQRFYHGTGELMFTAYYPYAKSRYQYLEDYTVENIPEWIDSDEILTDDFGSDFIYPAILQYDLSEEESALVVGSEGYFKLWLDNMDLLVDSDLDLQSVNSYLTVFTDGYNNFDEWKESSRIPSSKNYGHYLNGKYKLYNAGDFDMPFIIYYPICNIHDFITLQCNNKQIVLDGRNFSKQNNKDEYLAIDTRKHLIYGCDSKYSNNNTIYNRLITEGNFFNLPIGEVELTSSLEGKLEFNYLYL